MKNTRPSIYNHLPDISLFACAGVTFVIANVYPASKIIPSYLVVIGWIASLIGITLVIATMLQLRKHHTSTNPIDAPSLLITGGAFRFSRNPLYLGYVIIVLGCAFLSASYLSLLMPLVCFLTINYMIIPIEESVLFEKFGDTYTQYKRSAPRWL